MFGKKAVRRPRLQYLKQVARNTAADSYTAIERMACNRSGCKAANQSKDWELGRSNTPVFLMNFVHCYEECNRMQIDIFVWSSGIRMLFKESDLLAAFSVLGDFANLGKASSCLSVPSHGTTRLYLDGFSWNRAFEHISKICGEN